MSRIAQTFDRLKAEQGKGLIPFVTAGDPNLETTEKILMSLDEEGADIIELGIPFSDPMADGPTIQQASERALNAGTTLSGILELVSRFRRKSEVPIVLMGYFNPIFSFGCQEFAQKAAKAGVDGLLLVDLPAEEVEELHPFLNKAGIDLIQLIAPTTPASRMTVLAERGEGFIYYVSMTGVTGSMQVDPESIREVVTELKAVSRVPVAVGFGISTPAAAAEIGRFADAVVVGSALVKVVAEYGKSDRLIPEVGEFIRALKAGLKEIEP